MQLTERAALTGVLAGFVLLLLISAAGLGPVTRLVPIVVAVPTLAILSYQLRQDLLGQPPTGAEAASSGSARPAFLWILVLPPMLLVLGFLLGIPFHTLLFLRVRGREPWFRSVLMAAGSGVVMYTLSLLTARPELAEVPIWNWLVG